MQPQCVVGRGPLADATVTWYGGESRRVAWTSAEGGWYRSGHGLVPVRWVHVRDVQGTHRDEYFFATDPAKNGPEIISLFTARWPIETTFQEMRAHLGFETTRQRVAKSVLRMGPWLLGLFSLVCLIFAEHARHHRVRVRSAAWYAKTEPTFSDALATVRRLLWVETVFERPAHRKAFAKLPHHAVVCDRLRATCAKTRRWDAGSRDGRLGSGAGRMNRCRPAFRRVQIECADGGTGARAAWRKAISLLSGDPQATTAVPSPPKSRMRKRTRRGPALDLPSASRRPGSCLAVTPPFGSKGSQRNNLCYFLGRMA